MTKYTLLFVLIFLVGLLPSKGQRIQWADKVIDFSSELTPIQYSAKQLLGKPNVLPAGGESPNAWTPERANKKEFVKVGFKEAMSIKQIAIAESYNPSAVFRVLAYDEKGTEHVINTFSPKAIPLNGRMLNLFVEATPYQVVSLKIEFDGAAVPEYYSIDAVAISDSDIPITAEIELLENLDPNVEASRLSDNVNSKYKEYKPLLSPDGKVLYFSRKNHPENIGGVNDDEDIWYAERDSLSGDWKKAKNIGTTLNNKGPNFISSVTPDGKTVLVLLGNQYLKNGKLRAGVSLSSNNNGEWSEPKTLQIINEYNYSKKANFFLSNTRKTLIMAVERDDTHGDRDLYVSFLQKGDSVWSEPMNMGDQLNTAAEEASPYLAADNKTLYFSSKGFSGYGSSDIYVSQRLDDTWTNWSEPQNMGPDINSDKEELFFNIPASSEFAYYSKGVGDDDSDIFRVKMPVIVVPEPVITVRGKLINSKDNSPVAAKIVYERLSDGKEVGMIESDPKTGAYEILLPAGEVYGITAESEGYVPESQNIDLKDFEGKEFVVSGKNLFLVPIEKEAVVSLNNVFFDLNKASLKKASFAELNRIRDILTKRTSMAIEIAGHTDATGEEAYNLSLSERRAKTVYNYLIKEGVSAAKLTVKYFGESKPIATNNTVEGRRKNRRVEFKIVAE